MGVIIQVWYLRLKEQERQVPLEKRVCYSQARVEGALPRGGHTGMRGLEMKVMRNVGQEPQLWFLQEGMDEAVSAGFKIS